MSGYDIIKERFARVERLLDAQLISHKGANKLLDMDYSEEQHQRKEINAHIEIMLEKFPMGFDQQSLIDYIASLGYRRERIILAILVGLDDGYLEYERLGLLRLYRGKEGKM